MRSFSAQALLALCLLVSVPAAAPFAHEGHDHGDEPTASLPIAPRGSSVSDSLEVVAVARGGTLTVHVDRFATNEPVSSAEIDVDMPGGAVRARPAGPGTYTVSAPWAATPGEHEITVTVATGGTSEVFPVTLDAHGETTASVAAPSVSKRITAALAEGGIPLLLPAATFVLGLGAALLIRRRPRSAASILAAAIVVAPLTLRAHENHEAASPAAGPMTGTRDRAQRLPDGTLFVPKPTQRLLAIRTELTAVKPHGTAVEMPGRIIADPNGSGLVQSAQGGRLTAPPGGFPRLGTRVKTGDVLAYATPPVQLVDSSDMMQRQGELDQQIAIVERRVARFESLAKSAIVSQVQLDEARAELRGLRERRAGLDRIRAAPEALVSPIDGIVAEVNAVAGQIAQPSAVVFQVMDPKRLIVEALSFAAPAAPGEAVARSASGETARLRFLGTGLADRNQAVPVHFAVDGNPAGWRVGQFVTVTAKGGDERPGIALPRAGVVRGGNGQQVVWEKIAPETFAPREVRTEPLDGEHVLVSAGIAAGQRIATGGAELLNQIR